MVAVLNWAGAGEGPVQLSLLLPEEAPPPPAMSASDPAPAAAALRSSATAEGHTGAVALPKVVLSDAPGRALGHLPASVASAVWRGDQMGSATVAVASTGFAALDAELPGGGWPCHAVTEVLQAQETVFEWRLLGPAIRDAVARGKKVVIVSPSKQPHLPGLKHVGLDERHLVWVRAGTPSERLWVTEQLIKANAAGLLIAWLPQARPEQLRRLQVCAQGCESPVVLFRPAAAIHEASAAPLRISVAFGLDWQLRIQILKRKGPAHEGVIEVDSVPGGLEWVITPRLRYPSRFADFGHKALPTPSRRRAPAKPAQSPTEEELNALGSTAPGIAPAGRAEAH